MWKGINDIKSFSLLSVALCLQQTLRFAPLHFILLLRGKMSQSVRFAIATCFYLLLVALSPLFYNATRIKSIWFQPGRRGFFSCNIIASASASGGGRGGKILRAFSTSPRLVLPMQFNASRTQMNVERCSPRLNLLRGKIPVGNDGRKALMQWWCQHKLRAPDSSRSSHRDFHIHVMYFHFLIEVFFSSILSSTFLTFLPSHPYPSHSACESPEEGRIKSCKAQKLLRGKMKNHCIHPRQRSAVIYSFLLLAFQVYDFHDTNFFSAAPLRSSSKGAKKRMMMHWHGEGKIECHKLYFRCRELKGPLPARSRKKSNLVNALVGPGEDDLKLLKCKMTGWRGRESGRRRGWEMKLSYIVQWTNSLLPWRDGTQVIKANSGIEAIGGVGRGECQGGWEPFNQFESAFFFLFQIFWLILRLRERMKPLK